jgi:hypothetical protein
VAQKLHAAGDKVPVPFAVGGAHADQAVSAHVEAKTPLPSITEGGAGSAPMHVDFDLSDHEPADNLIDFEISDYSKDRKPGTP